MIELTTSATMDTIWRAPAIVFVLTMEAGPALTRNVSKIIIMIIVITMVVILLMMAINTLKTTITMDNKTNYFEEIMLHA